MLIYDVEIVKAIMKGEAPLEGIEYCEGWNDKAGMGISVIGAYDLIEDRYRVFTEEGFGEFEALASERFVVGFNSIGFDDELCRANGINVKTDWDMLLEIWDAAGGRYQKGFKLDNIAEANGLGNKTGHGAIAPVQWQHGEIGHVIDYCIADVRLTWRERIIDRNNIVNPINHNALIELDAPDWSVQASNAQAQTQEA